MSYPWPWPDSVLQRRTRIAHMYRDRLADEAPDACAEVDGLMSMCGQEWILGTGYRDPEALLTVAEIAEAADVTVRAVRNWLWRWPLVCRGTDERGRRLYRWGDVVERRT